MKKHLIALAGLFIAAALPASAQTTSTNPLKKPAPAVTAPAAPAPAAAPAAAAPATEAKKPSEAQMASRNRMKECGGEWQTMKKAGKTEGKTWRQFSSECLKKK
jgi:hypothetical protein